MIGTASHINVVVSLYYKSPENLDILSSNLALFSDKIKICFYYLC